MNVPNANEKPVTVLRSIGLVRALLPRYVGHYRLDPKTKWPLFEYWPGDEVWADTIHLHIYWNKTAHWFLFAMPDWACRKCPNVPMSHTRTTQDAMNVPNANEKPVTVLRSIGLVRALLPRYVGHYRLDPKTKWPLFEYWPGDEVWADTIHLHIYWNKTAHWFLFAMPDWACRKCPNDELSDREK